ncbi:hypothetical protein BGX38DRAFT_1171880 [Terfezia claveryi]|nr:hypothetical protein BGX38DRAFT_1171880 [Terfezia claveryi]
MLLPPPPRTKRPIERRESPSLSHQLRLYQHHKRPQRTPNQPLTILQQLSRIPTTSTCLHLLVTPGAVSGPSWSNQG